MSSENETSSENPTSDGAPDTRDLQDMVLHLNFVPTWARKPATQNPYARSDAGPEREPRRDQAPRRDDRNRGRGPGMGGGGGRGPRPDQGRGGRPAPRRDDRERHRPEAPPPRLPIEVAFIPERERLGAVVRQLHASQRAYPLMFVAGLFLNQPEHHLLKLECHGSGDPRTGLRLFQCDGCKAVFVDKEALQSHALARHMSDVFDIEDVQTDPPAGNFVCVARCRGSGELLGPPNYHGYNEKIQEVRRERFPHLSLDEYRKQVEMVHDAAVIEQWKEKARTQRVYKLKGGDPAAAPMKKAEAEAWFQDKHFPKLAHSGTRFVIPSSAMEHMDDVRLKMLIHEGWSRENRFPLKLSLALRPAFRRMRLNLFKAGRGETFVTAIHPRPMDGEHAVEPIKQIIRLLHENPGITRQQLLEKLHPGAAQDSDDAAKALSPLRWLIEKGHVIEFFNGTLSVPGGAHATQHGAESRQATV